MAEIPVMIGSRGTSRAVGLSGAPATGRVTVAEHRRAAVERLAHAVPHAAEPAVADGDLERAAFERDAHRGGVDAARCLRAPRRRRGRRCTSSTRPRRSSPEGSRTSASSSQPDALDARDDQQRARRAARARVFEGRRPGRHRARALMPRPSMRGKHLVAVGARRRRVVGSDFVAHPRDAREVELLDHRRRARPRVDQRRGTGRGPRAPVRAARPAWPRRRSRRWRSARSAAGPPRAAAGRPGAPSVRAGQGPRDRRARRSARAGRLRPAAATARARSRAQLGAALPRVPGRDRLDVARERAAPGDRRVVARVGEVAVQRPQRPHEPLGVGGDRLGHVAARRRDGADRRVTEPCAPPSVVTRPARS